TTTAAATTTTRAATTTTAAATTTTRAATTTTAAPTTTTKAATTTTTARATTTTVATTTTTTQAATGPTYYLSPNGNDSNSGSASAPWRTIQKAANTVNAGDTVVLMDGTYTEGSIGFNRSGTAAKPITFKAQNKWKAIVSSTSGCQPGFSINASYITVKDLTFGIGGNSCSTYTSSNVHIRAWNTVNPTPSNPTSGSAGFHADGLKLTGGLARSEGIKSNQDYTIIENVEADNALEIFNSKQSIIRNNNVTGQDQYGVSIFAKGGVRSAQIYGNVVRNKHNDGYGIYLGGYSCDTCFFDPSAKIEAYNSVAYNNVVINDSGHLNALVFAGAKDSAFFNNVVIGGGVVTMQGGYNTGFRANTTNPTLVNNIIICNGAQAHSGSYSGTYKVDSNNFYNCSGVPSQTNAVTGDPLFVANTSNWALQANSPARNRGAAVSFTGYNGESINVSLDKNGVTRSAPWDLGIYNY
ncbi:chondroitinase B-like protein, partial [Paucimonas lemoignei]